MPEIALFAVKRGSAVSKRWVFKQPLQKFALPRIAILVMQPHKIRILNHCGSEGESLTAKRGEKAGMAKPRS